MVQFNLETWLKDKSRKVVTRRGNPVRIICWDKKGYQPIVFLEDCINKESLITCDSDGTLTFKRDEYESPSDLFFADVEEELTEFEKMLASTISAWQISMKDSFGEGNYQSLKEDAKELLDLARKELERKNIIVDKDKYLRNCDYYYEQGKQDALKSFLKWKKATEYKDLKKHVAILEENKVLLFNYLEEGDYYIDLDDLKTLPKEE